jgi:hypothetical protein
MGGALRIEKSLGLNSGIDSTCPGATQFGFRCGGANDAGQISPSEAKEFSFAGCLLRVGCIGSP